MGDTRGNFRPVTEAEHVFVSDNYPMILAHGRGDRFPIVRRQGTKIDDLDRNALALELRRGHFRAVHDGSVGHDAYVAAFLHKASLTERHGVIRAGVFRAIVRLPVEMFVLEEHHRIVAADGGAQESRYVQRRRRHDHAQARTMRENRFTALAVINTATGKIAADGYAQNRG